jgi:DNA invertase Pin-like site-specific DNA recombinase
MKEIDMATGRFVAYYRVSTAKQGISGLGLEAQQAAVSKYLNGGDWKLVDSRTEVESGKRSDNRPKLAEALRLCRVHNATLIVAKLDRLARNVAFISALMEAGVKFIAVDMPFANEMVIHILAAVAQAEAKMCSDRTIAGLEAAKARGKVLGNPTKDIANYTAEGHAASLEARQKKAAERRADLMPILEDIKAQGITSLIGIAHELNNREVRTARGGEWSATQIKRVLELA